MSKLYLIGAGVGGESLLTGQAREYISRADRVLSTSRHSGGVSLAELERELENKAPGTTAVLVSGDCGFFSVSKSIQKKFSGLYDIELVSGISSVQYLSARIAVPYDDAVMCSMHGRDGRVVPKAAYNRKVFALTGGGFRAHIVCGMLCRAGLSGVRVVVGERLSYPDERISEGTAAELKDAVFGELSVMYIENDAFANPHAPLNDGDFIRGRTPMTKAEVRWLAIQKLGIMPTDTVYDIGAGTGSVSVETARRAFDGFVYAVEAREDACELITRNKIKHGAYNLEIVQACVPGGLDSLPVPDKAFIGGGSGNISEILDILLAKNPSVKIVSTAVTPQSVSRILAGYEKAGLAETDAVCVNIAKSKKTNGYDIMTAQNPIYIITGRGLG